MINLFLFIYNFYLFINYFILITNKNNKMENIKNINLKDIKENIYFLENYKIQFYINGIYIDIYDNYYKEINSKNFMNNIFTLLSNDNKKLNNLIYENVDEKIDENKTYLIYNTYETNFSVGSKDNIIKINLTNYIINSLTYYIFNFKQEKIKDYVNILKYNIISSKIKKIKIYEDNKNKEIDYIDKMYFNKNLFEEIYKLNLNFKIVLYNLNSFDKIINYEIKNENSLNYFYYILNNGNKLKYCCNYNSNTHETKTYYINNDDNIFYNLIYKETLIINCSNIEKLIDIDDNNEIKEENNKKDITNDLLIKEIEDLKEKNKRLLEINIGLNDDIIDLEKQLKEYKDKFDKLSLFFKN